LPLDLKRVGREEERERETERDTEKKIEKYQKNIK
jgi:hypothetical protein